MTRTTIAAALATASTGALAHAGHGAMTYHDHAAPVFLLVLLAVMAIAAAVHRFRRI